MNNWVTDHLAGHLDVARAMDDRVELVQELAEVLIRAFSLGGTLYTFGNGGSAADAQHFTGELIGRYSRERRPLPAVTLSTDPTVVSCIGNDYDFADIFARQVSALSKPHDVVAAFTTSGKSPNVVKGLAAARAKGATTVLFGGGDGGPAREHADFALLAPSSHTPRIQEMHTLMLHMLSEVVDAWAAGAYSPEDLT